MKKYFKLIYPRISKNSWFSHYICKFHSMYGFVFGKIRKIIRLSECVCVCVCVYLCVFMCVCKSVDTDIDKYMWICIYPQMHANVYMYIWGRKKEGGRDEREKRLLAWLYIKMKRLHMGKKSKEAFNLPFGTNGDFQQVSFLLFLFLFLSFFYLLIFRFKIASILLTHFKSLLDCSYLSIYLSILHVLFLIWQPLIFCLIFVWPLRLEFFLHLYQFESNSYRNTIRRDLLSCLGHRFPLNHRS